MCNHIYGLKYLILRVSNLYGKNQNISGSQGLIAIALGNLLQNKQTEVWGDGKVVRDYIYIDDLSKAMLLLIKKNKWNDTYNIGSGKGTSINKILQIIKKISGVNFNINYKEGRKIDVPTNILDISKLKNSIHLERLTPLEKGIKIYLKILKKEFKI